MYFCKVNEKKNTENNMQLNLPETELKIKKQEGKDYVFDRLRKQFVRLTPEEFVRQHFVSYLIDYKGYPSGLLSNEITISLGNVRKRCDTVLYDNYLHPLMIIEYKSPSIEINQKTFDQIDRYNMVLQVPWIVVTNGLQHFCCRVDYEKNKCIFEKEIPEYDELRTKS